ncbi:MAG: hypothetical protein JXQ75_03475 [Phycisphaerae bacterium]|nr:hypothetical protein [Phycisphaerae bacterium]
MVLVDAVVRLIPGVLGGSDSAGEESFSVPVARAFGPCQDRRGGGTADSGFVGADGLGGDGSARGSGLLEYPQYTRPRVFRGMEVPEVLLSGDHGKIRAWRAEQSLKRTRERRPDLLFG